MFDLRMQTMTSADALKFCLVITDLVRRTKNGVNKVIVFDEAHEYVDSKELVKELETPSRKFGTTASLSSWPRQFPERIASYDLHVPPHPHLFQAAEPEKAIHSFAKPLPTSIDYRRKRVPISTWNKESASSRLTTTVPTRCSRCRNYWQCGLAAHCTEARLCVLTNWLRRWKT